MSSRKPRSARLSVAQAPKALNLGLELGLDLSFGPGIDACPISRPRLRRVLLASLSVSEKPLRHGVLINLRLCDTKEARALNRAHRGKVYAPNVLTFEYPSLAGQALQTDIAICMPVVKKEALEQSKTLENHFIHLLVHGSLHALGFDHVNDHQAEVMEGLERKILKRFRISDPYVVSAPDGRQDRGKVSRKTRTALR
jgi:probable rRNA maturation factor